PCRAEVRSGSKSRPKQSWECLRITAVRKRALKESDIWPKATEEFSWLSTNYGGGKSHIIFTCNGGHPWYTEVIASAIVFIRSDLQAVVNAMWQRMTPIPKACYYSALLVIKMAGRLWRRTI
ncbi:MAG: hypothetical protein QGM50_11675, partial [Anaerolineae bacterium]|nr:hypothetical protein [Anaerolineae bacterium]